jgi:hypothetical protein
LLLARPFSASALPDTCSTRATATLNYSNPEVEIGAVKLGMSVADYKSLTLSGLTGLQFGSVVPATEPEVTFREGKLDSFQMDFYTYKYEYMRDALKAKYPSMSCEQVQADKYIAYDHERCLVGNTLVIAQGKQGGRPSALYLESAQHRQDQEREIQLLTKQKKGV